MVGKGLHHFIMPRREGETQTIIIIHPSVAYYTLLPVETDNLKSPIIIYNGVFLLPTWSGSAGAGTMNWGLGRTRVGFTH
jgi:hypothetical protein